MQDVYFIQLVGLLIAAAGAIALTATAAVYGSPLSREEEQRHGNLKGNVYRLPFRWETVASALFLLGGIGVLTWAKFDLCSFLAHWLPDLPEALRIFLSCR